MIRVAVAHTRSETKILELLLEIMAGFFAIYGHGCLPQIQRLRSKMYLG